MIAALPMYDRPEMVAANDALWEAVRARLGRGPETLTRDASLWDIWEAPELVLSQTCSLPFRARLRGRVQLLGSPDFRLPDCPPGHYYSVLVKRRDDRRDLAELMRARVVINQVHSHSGHVALRMAAEAAGLSPNIVGESDGHLRSARMIFENRADLAVIDANSWRLIRRFDSFASELAEIGRSPATAAMPFICAMSEDAAAVRAALAAAISDLPGDTREIIGLHGLVDLPETAYCDLPMPPET